MQDQQSQFSEEEFNIIKEDAKLAHANHRDDLRAINHAAIGASATAAKALLITNGGAVIAMLGFVATISGGNGDLRLDIFAASDALVWFAWGVAASIFVSLFAYLVLYFQAEAEALSSYTWTHPYVERRTASVLLWILRTLAHILAVCAAIAALHFFVCGIFAVEDLIETATTVGVANCQGHIGGWWFFCQSQQ